MAKIKVETMEVPKKEDSMDSFSASPFRPPI